MPPAGRRRPRRGKPSIARDSEGIRMLRKLGGLIFILLVVVASIGFINFLSESFYQKSLLAVVKDFLFMLTRK
jgi:hypothetical protein